MIDLKTISIVSVDCITPITAIKAIEFSCRKINFKEAILFTDAVIKHDWIKIIKINKINNLVEYSKFMVNELPHFINDHCLVVQSDGFVINPERWNDKFHEYDYIGAPWDLNGCRAWKKKIRIGNGGFSFRSRKLMNLLKDVKDYDGVYPEDSFISDFVADNNLSYPDTSLAVTFSLECPLEDYPFDLTKSFGFHGKMIYNNLFNYCPYLFE